VIASATVGALVSIAANALAGSGIGGIFNLGVSNTVDAQTSLTGSAGGNAQLRVENGAGGSSSFGVLGKMSSSAASATSAGVRGINSASSSNGYGVWALHQGAGAGLLSESRSGLGARVIGAKDGLETSTGAQFMSGVYAHHDGTSSGNGVYATTSVGNGVQGTAWQSGIGVWGRALGPYGVVGIGIKGTTTSAGSSSAGVYGESTTLSPGVVGYAKDWRGVEARSTNNLGLLATSVNDSAIWASSWDDTKPVLFLRNFRGGGPLIHADKQIDAGGVLQSDTRFRVENNGNVYADGSYNCGLSSSCFNSGVGADVAERIDPSGRLRPGELIEIDPARAGRYRLTRRAASALVAGVVSTRPAVTMNNRNRLGKRRDGRPLIALVGTAPVRVTAENGAIRPGDMLVSSSTPGRAMRAGRDPAVGTVVGKALGPLARGSGTIRMLIMLR